MKKFTFSNKESKIEATIDNNIVTYEDGNSYTISARYGADGISGAYITVDGVTYSLKAAEFKQVADELVPYIQAQPKKERKADGGAAKAKNLVKLASVTAIDSNHNYKQDGRASRPPFLRIAESGIKMFINAKLF